MNRYWCFTCKNQREDRAMKKRYCSELGDYISLDIWCFTKKLGCKKYKINPEMVLNFYGEELRKQESKE